MVTEALGDQDCSECLQLYGKHIASNSSKLLSCDLACTGNYMERVKFLIFILQKTLLKMHLILSRRKSIENVLEHVQLWFRAQHCIRKQDFCIIQTRRNCVFFIWPCIDIFLWHRKKLILRNALNVLFIGFSQTFNFLQYMCASWKLSQLRVKDT